MWLIHKVHELHASLQHLVHGLGIKNLQQGFVIKFSHPCNTLVLPDCRWLQAPTEAARLNARPLQGHSRGNVKCLLVTGNWCVTSLVYRRQNSVPCIIVRTSPLACTAVQYSRSAQHLCPLLAPAAPRWGGGTRPEEPARMCLRQRPCHTGMHMHVQLACAYSCTCCRLSPKAGGHQRGALQV